MPTIITQTGLFLCSPIVYASIILVGFLSRDEKIYGRTLILLLFTMIYNLYLKSIWQMPLPPPHEGWAFPSGHMHSAFVFWVWLACEYRKLWFSTVVFFILGLVGYSIVNHGFHYPIDIAGAIGFGTVSVLIYALLNRLSFFKEKPYRLGMLLGLMGFGLIMLLAPEFRKPHVWQALGTLIGFSFGWFILQLKPIPQFSGWRKLSLLIIALGVSWLLFIGLGQLPLLPKEILFAQFFAIAFWISTCKRWVAKIFKKKTF